MSGTGADFIAAKLRQASCTHAFGMPGGEVLALMGALEEAETYTHQVFDHAALLRPVVKASFRAAPGALGAMMDKAILTALDGRAYDGKF